MILYRSVFSLPLRRVESALHTNQLFSPQFPDTKLDIAHSWEDHHFDSFLDYQKYMLAPCFTLNSKEVLFYDLEPNAVLPFIEVEEKKKLGHHGSVQRVKIHLGHHNAQPVWIISYNIRRAH
jgi:hypothetical protein